MKPLVLKVAIGRIYKVPEVVVQELCRTTPAPTSGLPTAPTATGSGPGWRTEDAYLETLKKNICLLPGGGGYTPHTSSRFPLFQAHPSDPRFYLHRGK